MKGRLKVKTSTDRATAIAYLEDLLQAIRSGSIHVESEGKSLSLVLAEDLSLKVQASQKDDREKLEFSLQWYSPVVEPT